MLSRLSLLPVLVYFILGTGILLVTPYGAFPDEQSHFKYARFIFETRSLPPLEPDIIPTPEAFQAPLYYACSTIAFALSADEVTRIHALRFFSLLLGGGTLLLIYAAARRLFPERPALPALVVAIPALNPQFIFTHAGISNISMASLTSALTFLPMVRMVQTLSPRALHSALLGACTGLALLSRTTTIYLIPACVIAITVSLARSKRVEAKTLFVHLSAYALAALFVSGWWYIRNWLYYGDPFLWNVHQTTMGAPWARSDPPDFMYVIQSLAFLHASFWAYFGRNEFHAGIPEYAVLLLFTVVGVIGMVEILLKRGKDVQRSWFPQSNRPAFLLLGVAAILAFSEIVILQLRIASPQGRYLYMAMLPISVLLGAGFYQTIPRRYSDYSVWALILFLLAMCLHLLYWYWLPHYW